MQFPQSIPWGPGLVGAAGRDSMHNHGSMGRDLMQFPRWIHRPRRVGVPSSDLWGPGLVGAAGRDSMHNHGSMGAGTRCSSLDGSQGTWLEFHRVINADRAGSMHNHGSQGQKYADVGKHWVNVCRRRQTPGRHDAPPRFKDRILDPFDP
jgi:hypothetical protein